MKTLIIVCMMVGLQAKSKDLDQETKNLIHKAAVKYNVPEWELLKIAFVESTLHKNPKMRTNKNGTFDVGMFQINSVHWYDTCKGIDVLKLNGNIMCAAKLLSQHKSKASTDKDWVARYHSKTPKHKTKYAKALAKAETYLISKNIGSYWYVANN